jgi:hypothetical protein
MATYADRIKVFIPKNHLEVALRHAAQRNGKESYYGSMTYIGSKTCHEGLAAHELGIRAELGMSLYWGANYDKRVFSQGDDGQDMQLPQPLGYCQIKGNTYYTDTDLRCEVEHDHPLIESYVLVVVPKIPERSHIVELSGWLPRSKVITRAPRKYRGSKTALNYIWKEQELEPHPFLSDNMKRCLKTYYNATPEPEQEFWEYVRELQKRAKV